MEYEKVLQCVGPFGKFQKIMIGLLVLPVMFNAGTTHFFNFILGNHLHRCQRPDVHNDKYSSSMPEVYLNKTSTYNASQCTLYQNGTETICDKWVFDQSVYRSTLISKFDIVCDNKFTRSHILSAFFFGHMFGAMIAGVLTDIFGRKPVLISSVILLCVSNVISPLLPNVWLVAVCQAFNAVGSIANYSITVVIATEIVGPTYRVFASFCLYITYCIGEFILLSEAYFLRDFTDLMIIVAIPFAACLFIFLFIPESPRWLISKNKNEQAKEILQKMASYNKAKFEISVDQMMVKEKDIFSFKVTMEKLFKSKSMMVRFVILTINWFSINLIYYGLGMNVGDLGGNVYVNFAISSTAETMAIFISYFSDKFPRRWLFSAAMILGSSSCFSTFFTSYFGGESLHWVTICLAMVGKLGVSISFFLVYLITTESFPTVMRATLLGICLTSGKIGALVSPYIGKLGVLIETPFGLALPLIIFGSIGLVAGILDLFLPETRNIKLPDTFDDIAVVDRSSCSDVHDSDFNMDPLS